MIICLFDIFDALHLISFQGSITLVCVNFWPICYFMFIVFALIALFGEVFNPLHPRLHHLFLLSLSLSASHSPSLTYTSTSPFNWLINCALNSYLSFSLSLSCSQSIHISLILSRWMFSSYAAIPAPLTLQMMLQIRFKWAFSCFFLLFFLLPLSSYYCIYSTVCCSYFSSPRVPFCQLKWINSFSPCTSLPLYPHEISSVSFLSLSLSLTLFTPSFKLKPFALVHLNI